MIFVTMFDDAGCGVDVGGLFHYCWILSDGDGQGNLVGMEDVDDLVFVFYCWSTIEN